MPIDHIAIWTADIERLTQFYRRYFGASAAPRYSNPSKGFESIFLSFGSGARIEVMKTTGLEPRAIAPGEERMGLTHLAISVGSTEAVDRLAQQIKAEGHPLLDGPRRTGDGYYECVVLDPDGNRVEISA